VDDQERRQQTEQNRALLVWLMDLYDRKKLLDEDLAKWEKAFHERYNEVDAALNGEANP